MTHPYPAVGPGRPTILRREMAIPVLLFAIAVVARAVAALLFADAAYPDSYYYASVADSIAAGRGLEIDYIWNFVDVGGVLPAEGILPIASNGHWMPLAALVQVPSLWLLGSTPIAAALPFWIASGLAASLTWFIGRDAGLPSWQAGLAGVLVALPGGMAPYLGQPDNFSIFMLLGALALWCCARGLRGDRRAFAAGGLVVGLAFLARTDGVLLGVPFALAAAADVLRRPRLTRIGGGAIVVCVIGFVVVAAPWVARQIEVFGSVSPSAANGRILWLTEYGQLYSVSTETTLASFLEQGLGAITWSRVGGLAFALVLFASLPLLFVLVPFVGIGIAARWRDRAFVPWLVYAVTLFAFSALVSAIHVPYGTFIHSAVALVPHAYLAAIIGVGVAVAWVGRRRSGWDVPRATRNLTTMLVAIVVVVSAGATVATMRAWESERTSREPVLATLAEVATPGDVVMSADAGAYWYHGGWPGIVTPSDPLPVVEEAARRYGARWLALEAEHIVPALVPVLTGETQPSWLSEPILVVPAEESPAETPGSRGAEEEADPLDQAPRAALYAVCLDIADPRCAR
jgi:hypothetical protein